MENLFNSSTTLMDAERILESFFKNTYISHQIVKCVPMTLWDTQHLLNLFDNVKDDRIDLYEPLNLAIIVAWVFAIKYNISSVNFKKSFLKDISLLPQHHIRYYIDILGSTFEEFGICSFGHNYYSPSGICAIVDLHGCL